MAPPHPERLPPFSALLSVVGEDGQKTTYPFRHPRIVVGRKRENDLSLPDQHVSSEHCEFFAHARELWVRDLGSQNGTYVNEKRVPESRLFDGDVVRIGGTRITLSLQGTDEPGFRTKRVRIDRGKALLFAGLAVAFAGGVGIVVAVRRGAEAERELRERYEEAVRTQVQDDACAAAPDVAPALKSVDARIGRRSVALQLRGGRVVLSAADRKTDLELLGLYRQKIELYDRLLGQLAAYQQEQRDGLERISRLGARFRGAKDRKLAFWTEGMLQDRIVRGDAFVRGVEELRAKTQKFADLVEAVTVREDAGAVSDLTAFRFPKDYETLLKSCALEASRSTSSVLGAVNAIED